ncbi:MAG: BCCT family transporter [Deltaproteobacteria bacterium]|nr:BCCT family transporter [Deltaproteobacteria bacterium]MBK8715122.1 BCCT family transporter [Deltaproteobacteria bacterium]MBP7287140.1 BCCT family transporter [Nannocystaceae bacterium]
MEVAPKARDRSFVPALLACAAVAVLGVVTPDLLSEFVVGAVVGVIDALDVVFLAITLALVVLSAWFAFGRHARRRLGGPTAQPEFSSFAWISMLFAAGMGSGLMFWGVAEPLIHGAQPPLAIDGVAQARRQALAIADMHWGLHAWAIYGVAALVLGYFHFCRGTDYLPGAPMREVMSRRWGRPLAAVADLIGVLAIAFGVAGSVGMGVLQIRSGLSRAFGVVDDTPLLTVAILVLLVTAYTASAVTKLDRGIKWLSALNVVLAVGFMLLLLLWGDTALRLQAFATSLLDYPRLLLPMSTMSGPWSQARDWMHDWTIAYLVWWIAWAPFVGVFVARISRGRTFREFIVAVLLVPTVFSMLWFAVLGGTAAALDGDGAIARVAVADPPTALFETLARMPFASVLSALAVVLVFLFLVTSVDSAAYVLGVITSGGAADPSPRRKLAWGVVLGLLGAGPVLSGRVDVVKAVAIVGAIPFTLVLVLQTGSLLVALRRDRLPRSPPGRP